MWDPGPGADDDEDDDCIEVLDVVKKQVIDFSGAPEFQWRRSLFAFPSPFGRRGAVVWCGWVG